MLIRTNTMCLLWSLPHRTILALEKDEAWHTYPASSTYHTAKIRDCCIFVRIGIQQHLSICVKREVSPYVLLVFSEEVSYSFHFRLRFWERSTVCIITRVHGSSFICKLEKKMGWRDGQARSKKHKSALLNWFFFYFCKHTVLLSSSSNFSFKEINTEKSKTVQASMRNGRAAWIGTRCCLFKPA